MKYIFHEAVKLFKLGKTTCIGNYDNGSIIALDDKTAGELIKAIKYKEETKSFYKNNEDLFHALEEGSYFEKDNSLLYSCYLHVTNRCNLHCTGCYSEDSSRNNKDILELEDIKGTIAKLYEAGVRKITISGGEPLLRKDIGEIVRFAKEEAGIETINLITNGTVHNRKALEDIRPYINDLAVSVDGYSKKNPTFLRDDGIFERVMKFVEMVKSMGFQVCILPTLHDKNTMAIDEYFRLAADLGVNISFSLMTCTDDFADYIPEKEKLKYIADFFGEHSSDLAYLLKEYEVRIRKTCGAGKHIISIAADGCVYPCQMLHKPELKMGNIKEERLSDILSNKIDIPDVESISGCKTCEVREICGGGCKARAYIKNNEFLQPDPYCCLNYKYYGYFLSYVEQICNSH